MKVSVFLTTYNKNDVLPNTLYSISRQKTSFPFEVCIVDDCSKVDPKPIINKFLPKAKYLRLPKNEGFLDAKVHCLDMMSSDTEFVIIHHVGVVPLQDFAYEEIVKYIKHKELVYTEVRNLQLAPCTHKNYDMVRKQLLAGWDRRSESSYQTYTGAKLPNSWLFYLGGILKEDLDLVKYRECSCDAGLGPTMKEIGFEANILNYVRSIHQYHPKIILPCHRADTCNFYCSRTGKFRGIEPGEFYYKNAKVIYER